MTTPSEGYTRREVTARGFEARCIAEGRVEYLWHLGCGLRADPNSGARTLITDPAALPEGPWMATELGREELRDPTLLELL